MTSSLRRKRRTTVPPTMSPRTGTNRRRWLAAIAGSLVAVAPCLAQQPQPNCTATNNSQVVTAPRPAPKAGTKFTIQAATDDDGTTASADDPPPLRGPTSPVVVEPIKPAAETPAQKPAAPPAKLPEVNRAARPLKAAPASEAVKKAPVKQVKLQESIPAPAGAQPPSSDSTSGPQTLEQYGIEVNPPPKPRLYRLESEAALHARMTVEVANRPPIDGKPESPPEFPIYPPLSTQPYQARANPGMIKQIEPNYVCYNRLYYEEVNSERYGWDLGAVQPFVSAGYFFKDLFLFPYHFGTRPRQRYDCSAGHCMPGDPVPYLLYPQELSATGLGAQIGTVAAIFALFP